MTRRALLLLAATAAAGCGPPRGPCRWEGRPLAGGYTECDHPDPRARVRHPLAEPGGACGRCPEYEADRAD